MADTFEPEQNLLAMNCKWFLCVKLKLKVDGLWIKKSVLQPFPFEDNLFGVLLLLSSTSKRPRRNMRLFVVVLVCTLFGFYIGINFPSGSFERLKSSSDLLGEGYRRRTSNPLKSKPKGAEQLPMGIIEAESDLYLRRLVGKPSEDLIKRPKYLVTFTVGIAQKKNIDLAVEKFSKDFTIVLFHYDGRTTEWDEFEWSKRAIHISAPKQTKWWYAKRFLHPDVVAPYDYIFIWDEDLGVEHFNAEEYIKMVKKHGLEISQPGLQPNPWLAYQMTGRRNGQEVHKQGKEKPGRCTDPHEPPCAAFIEIMAPVFSRDAWRCVWHLIQNDLVHGWGLDFALRKCVEPAHEKIGVVDAHWIVHQGLPSLGNGTQGQPTPGKTKTMRQLVRERCVNEWKMFQKRLEDAEMSQLTTVVDNDQN